MNATPKRTNNQSAGIGDPYWYEWGIGLFKVVEMLNPDSGIDAVAFQKDGIKGWDDVIIKFSSGHKDYYQVKHSRPGTNLTFSDLVSKAGDTPSLLASLTDSWHEMDQCSSDSSCILITNRSAGTRAGRSQSGILYPPLADFIRLVSSAVQTASELTEVTVPKEWEDAWGVWLDEMGSISDENKLQFLKQLTISVDATSLGEMRERLAESLAWLFQTTKQQADPLVQRLLSALFDWTTSMRGTKEWITAEDVMTSIADSNPAVYGFCDVPTPVPFFLSREQTVKDICSMLTNDDEHKVVFLEAEPGSGKTSVVSRIVNQRVKDYSALVVDIRYYAYKPITPDAPMLSADADRSASPESLWYTLLSQIRERLRGRLLQLRVPVRNNFTTPDEARDHVLRLAALLGEEKGSPFVIAIDGIDHAARASRKGLLSLLGSMPPPEIVPKGVRLLIAGQPASAYTEYPIWLRGENRLVKKSSLGPVDIGDISLLLSHSSTDVPAEEYEHAARIIQAAAEGNTLATVFAVAEAQTCKTLTDLETRLAERKLHAGIHAYYAAIWNAAIPVSPVGLGAYLSSVLCLLRERITGVIMQKAFPCWEMSAPEWTAILKKLEPLVVCDTDGYRVRHNDIRVFLEQELKSDANSLREVASHLSEYYMGASADHLFGQHSLFTLLQLAGREVDKARVFTPYWVLDAVACGRDLSTVYEEAEDAFRVIPEVKEWDVALSVACGGMTLAKMSDCLDAFPDLLDIIGVVQPPLPQCLETERFVLPFNQWDERTIRQVLDDARLLASGGEMNRARGMMEHWFANVSPAEVVSEVKGMTDDHGFRDGPTLAMGADALFEDWGSLSFRLGIATKRDGCRDDLHHQATYLFEKGWVIECVTGSETNSICTALTEFTPHYLGTFEVAVEKAAERSLWNMVASLLDVIQDEMAGLQSDFRVKAAFWALKAKGLDAAGEWLEVLPEARTGKMGDARISMPLMLGVAKAIGWLEPHRDSTAIASELADAVIKQGRHVREPKSLLLPLRAAVMIGLAERMLSKGDAGGAAALLPSSTIHTVIDLIWAHRHSFDLHEHGSLALTLTFRLIELCLCIGGSHGEMVVSLAMSETESFPVDQKMPVLWEVLRRAGRADRLRSWAEHWIGNEGAAWSGLDYSERASIVGDLCRFCRAEGWNEIADTAEGRLRHRLIGYSGHKEYAFQEPLDWIEELFLSNPSAWREEGIQLLDICHECAKQGGDNRLSSQIENEIAAAAFRCGPGDAHAFFRSVDPNIEQYWLQTVRTTLIAASKRAIAEHIVTDPNDVIALWCCAVGLTRWFDRNQAQTVTALRNTILSSVDSDMRQQIEDRLRSITPGEFLREEYDKDLQGSGVNKESSITDATGDSIGNCVSELVQKVAAGYEPNLMEVGHLVMRVVQQNPKNRADLLLSLFAVVDANSNYIASWDSWGQSHPLKEMIPILRESEMWELVRAAVRTTGCSYWSRSVPHNIHLICLYRATSRGAECLKRGTQRVFAMHRLWAGLAEPDMTDDRKPPDVSNVNSWLAFGVAVLKRLISSDSAETVTAALRGLCALAEISPNEVAETIPGSKGIERSRLLLGSEVWAARHPSVFTPVLEDAWNNNEEFGFRDIIQLWICGLAATQIEGGFSLTDTFIPENTPTPEAWGNRVLVRPKKLLAIGPRMQGSVRLANAYSSARNWIDRLDKITGCDTTDIEAAIAERLENQSSKVNVPPTRTKKKYFATEEGDMLITSGVEGILDEALLMELCKPGWADEDAGDVALAVTHGDDPWILRRSPLPSPASFDWPNQKEVEEWLDTKQDKTAVLNRLRLLARGGDLSPGEIVMGSCLRVYTSYYDLEMWYWLEAKSREEITSRRPPFCPSSRSFQFFLPNRFEPYSPDRAPLVLFSGSFSYLSFSRMEVIPSRVLQEHLGWTPTPWNPLEWTKDHRVVARYEIYHGPLGHNWSRRHMRQPTLARWVVNSNEVDKLGSFSAEWDHEVHKFSDD